jgi:hypothetical protein
MAEFRAIDAASFEKAGSQRRRSTLRPRAVSARFDRRTHRLTVKLDTGIDFSFDPRRAFGLQDANPEDLARISIEGVGSTLRFPGLDADFSVARLLEGFLGPIDWTRRQARAAASRENGKRGGRPRKEPAAQG